MPQSVPPPTALRRLDTQGAAQQVAVFSRRYPSPVDVADHLIAEILVVNGRVGLEQSLRAARRDERRVELAVIALPQLGRRAIACRHAGFECRELVVGGDDATFPFQIAMLDCRPERVALEQEPHPRHFPKTVRRHGLDLESALALGDDEPFRAKPVQDFPKRAHADAVARTEGLELQLLSRGEPAENDVAPDGVVRPLAYRLAGHASPSVAHLVSVPWLRAIVKCAMGP